MKLTRQREAKGWQKEVSVLVSLARSKKEFDGFIQSAEVIPSKLRIILSAPKMKKHGLSFDAYSIVTDVTYKADEDGYYLCSSVLYVHNFYPHSKLMWILTCTK